MKWKITILVLVRRVLVAYLQTGVRYNITHLLTAMLVLALYFSSSLITWVNPSSTAKWRPVFLFCLLSTCLNDHKLCAVPATMHRSPQRIYLVWMFIKKSSYGHCIPNSSCLWDSFRILAVQKEVHAGTHCRRNVKFCCIGIKYTKSDIL